MRGVRAAQLWPTRRRIGFDVAADVPRRQAQGTQASDLKMCEVLANTAARLEHVGNLAGDRSRGGVEREILVNPASQVAHRVKDWTFGHERNPGIVEKIFGQRDQWGWIGEFMGFERLSGMIIAAAGTN